MSSYTYVERRYLDDVAFELGPFTGQIDALVSKRGLQEDVADDIKRLLIEGEAEFALASWSVIEILAGIAAMIPKVAFAARGLGEDPRMIWLREYEEGREIFAYGPPEGVEA